MVEPVLGGNKVQSNFLSVKLLVTNNVGRGYFVMLRLFAKSFCYTMFEDYLFADTTMP